MIYQKRNNKPVQQIKVPLTSLISPQFYKIHNEIKKSHYLHVWNKGGRGSTKSSFSATEIVLGMMQDPEANAIVFRRYKADLRDSVFAEIETVIRRMGVEDDWNIPESKLVITYKPTGQKIIFKGADKAKKRKGTTVGKGYFKFIWYEELEEFEGMEKIRSINQSLIRGDHPVFIFYTYNPPKSARSWVNKEAKKIKKNTMVVHSTYKDVPEKWLGKAFIEEAKELEQTNPSAYNHEYMGIETGTGAEVFDNLVFRTLSDRLVATFDNIRQGEDWGYFPDPFAFVRMHYDKTRRRLYFIAEHKAYKSSNTKTGEYLISKGYDDSIIIADSAEPKSVADHKALGLNVKSAKKGPGSVDYGIKWLADEIDEIIIDRERTPHIANEFENYALERNSQGELIERYPDKDNHFIDATRYGMEDDMNRKGKWGLKRK